MLKLDKDKLARLREWPHVGYSTSINTHLTLKLDSVLLLSQLSLAVTTVSSVSNIIADDFIFILEKHHSIILKLSKHCVSFFDQGGLKRQNI